MKNFYLFILLSAFCTSVYAQETASFEDLGLPDKSYWNGADGSGSFSSGGITFYNGYDPSWGSWNGFSYTNMTDAITQGYGNQYSAIAGAGNNNSAFYATAYYYGTLKAEFANSSNITGLYVTNSTYAYLTMRNGDEYGYSKKFGGVDGIDPDYFKLNIYGVNELGDTTGIVEFYLADFRFDNSLMDYIISDWTWIDLSLLGEVKEIHFALESTDSGAWGMNTPAYFCLDDVNGQAPVDPLAGNTIATIEDLSLDIESHYDGSDMAGGFTSGGFHFNNNYNADWFSWSGFAASNTTDSETRGWANQYSSIAGSGAKGSAAYVVGYGFRDMDINFESQVINGFYATNSTYTFWSMKEGDAYAKKFGGDDGTGPDWFLLTIEGFDSLQNSSGTVEFYLADFRNGDASKDYILDSWKYVDLSSLGEISNLHFRLSSSDMGDWGMNTPAYFCMDELNYFDLSPIVVNPIADIGHFDNPDRVFYVLIDSVFTDPDDPDSLMVYTIENIDDTDLVSVSIVKLGESEESLRKNLVINITREATGEAIITLGATSNGKTTLHSFKIVVNFYTNAEFILDKTLSAYPNPFNDRVFVTLPENEGRLILMDISGKVLIEKEVINQSNFILDGLNELKSGIYILNLSTAMGRISKKIIKN